jgi:hypothetical protein
LFFLFETSHKNKVIIYFIFTQNETKLSNFAKLNRN